MKRGEQLRMLGDLHVLNGREDTEIYSHDIGDLPPIMTNTLFTIHPDFVVQPKNEEGIRKILTFASQYNLPVIPRGTASWGFGGVIPTKGGIVVDLSPFRKIVNIDINKKTSTVQAGARWGDIDLTVKKHGLSLMAYPSSKFSTVGGWIATGGYGINSYKYGHVSRQIETMKVIVPSGETKELKPDDPEFGYFIGTEGIFGIIVEITLRLRDSPNESYPHLVYLENDRAAFEFIQELVVHETLGKEAKPNVIRFLDENHLQDTNEVLRAAVFEIKSSVLVEFGAVEHEKEFLKFLSSVQTNAREAPRYCASYLWNERLFGMKTKRLGPTILASEVIIPIDTSAAFIDRAKKLGSNYDVEIGIDSYIIDTDNTLIMATFLCDSTRLKYFVNLPLVSMLTRIAVSMGAKPYGTGIWNAPFFPYRFDKGEIRRLKAHKARLDPHYVLNPGKFFGVRSKFFNIPGMGFSPLVYNRAMDVMIFLSPLIGPIVTLLLGRNKKVTQLDEELSTRACAKCGNCIAVCPAYLITNNEKVTAKGKIALAKKLLAQHPITQEESDNAFMCMHCKACEQICQTNLELMSLWTTIEERLAHRFGRPDAKIVEFLKMVDESNEYWDMVERSQ